MKEIERNEDEYLILIRRSLIRLDLSLLELFNEDTPIEWIEEILSQELFELMELLDQLEYNVNCIEYDSWYAYEIRLNYNSNTFKKKQFKIEIDISSIDTMDENWETQYENYLKAIALIEFLKDNQVDLKCSRKYFVEKNEPIRTIKTELNGELK